MSTLSLPQPPSIATGQAHQETRRPYKYVPYDVLEIDWLGDPQRIINQSSFTDDKNINNGQTRSTTTTNATNNSLQQPHHDNNTNDARYAPGTLVWVLLSKGKPKKQPPTTSSANKKNAQHQQQQQLEQGGYNALALHRKRRDKKNKRMSSLSLSSNNTNAKEGNNHQGNENNKDGSTKEETTAASTVSSSGDNNNNSSVQSNENKKCKIDNDNNNNTTAAIVTTPLNQSRKEFFLRARVLTDDEPIPNNNDDGVAAVDNDDDNDNDDDYNGPSSSSIQKRRMARRILVRYSKGSTYRVRAYNLVPILEPSIHYDGGSIDTTTSSLPLSLPLPVSLQNNGEREEAIHHQQSSQSVDTSMSVLPPMVVLVPETNIYRRIAKVHATPDDSFMEIGCDYGITVDKIRASLEEAGNVPKVWPIPSPPVVVIDSVEESKTKKCDDGDDNGLKLEEQREEEGDVVKRVSCLGVDKSKESIGIANERYPKCKFSLGNILVPEEMSSIRTLCERSLVGCAPSIICIDVNGNREISGVLECLKMVMNESWKRQPRMIIVKSRFLYWELKKMGNGDGGGGVNGTV